MMSMMMMNVMLMMIMRVERGGELSKAATSDIMKLQVGGQ